jgi:caa(3)-type oxidase subunit IV
MAEHAAHPETAPAEGHEHREEHGHAPATPESIRKEKNTYFVVFGALAVLTVATVLISRVHFERSLALFIGLGIATIKGTLVAGFFMHLFHERKFVYSVLGLTVFFFAVLLWGPWHHNHERMQDWGQHGATQVTTTSTAAAPAHESGH